MALLSCLVWLLLLNNGTITNFHSAYPARPHYHLLFLCDKELHRALCSFVTLFNGSMLYCESIDNSIACKKRSVTLTGSGEVNALNAFFSHQDEIKFSFFLQEEHAMKTHKWNEFIYIQLHSDRFLFLRKFNTHSWLVLWKENTQYRWHTYRHVAILWLGMIVCISKSVFYMNFKRHKACIKWSGHVCV